MCIVSGLLSTILREEEKNLSLSRTEVQLGHPLPLTPIILLIIPFPYHLSPSPCPPSHPPLTFPSPLIQRISCFSLPYVLLISPSPFSFPKFIPLPISLCSLLSPSLSPVHLASFSSSIPIPYRRVPWYRYLTTFFTAQYLSYFMPFPSRTPFLFNVFFLPFFSCTSHGTELHPESSPLPLINISHIKTCSLPLSL
jgi:hypothetical protein